MDNNPDRALCRFEYVELIVRIAMIKYNKTAKSEGIGDAVCIILQKIFVTCNRKDFRLDNQLP